MVEKVQCCTCFIKPIVVFDADKHGMLLQAVKIPDASVILAASVDQPVIVQSSSAAGSAYRVFNAASQWASCECIRGTKGQLSKHQVKVLQLQTQASARNIVRFCGTLAASAAGSWEALASQQQQSQPFSAQKDVMDCSPPDLPQVLHLDSQPQQTQSVQNTGGIKQRDLPLVRR